MSYTELADFVSTFINTAWIKDKTGKALDKFPLSFTHPETKKTQLRIIILGLTLVVFNGKIGVVEHLRH